jgi:hypothetical protein
MSYKPFAAIDLVKQYYDRAAKGSRSAFVQLESLLKALELPECDTMQIKNVVLNDSVEISDSGDLTIYGGEKQYALICTGTPGASGICPNVFPIADRTYLDILMSVRIDKSMISGPIITIKNQSDAFRLSLGFEISQLPNPYIQIGADTYSSPFQNFFDDAIIEDWFELGCGLDFTNSADPLGTIYVNGQASPASAFVLDPIPSSTEDTIVVGCDGISIRMLAFVWSAIAPTRTPGTITPPFPIQRLPYAIHYYNFHPGVLPPEYGIADLSMVETYNTPLTLNEANATIEAVEVI